MVDQVNPYSLSVDQKKSAYEDILEQYAPGTASLRFPRLVILGGQPGAGKSTILNKIASSFDPDKQPVIAAMDNLREFHMAARAIVNHHPFGYAIFTNEEAWEWTRKLLTHARQARNNTIYEGTLRAAAPVEVMIEAFQSEGFAVDLHALAVNSKHSIQGIYRRYERQHETLDIPRWTPIAFHDDSYRNFPQTVAYLEANAGFEKVVVYRRDNSVLYQNSDRTTAWKSARDAIVAERQRAWTSEEKADLVRSWSETVGRIAERQGAKPDWYVENARKLQSEASLFSASRQARADDCLDLSLVEAVTHHHIFARNAADGELVCFDGGASAKARLPGMNLRLTPQPPERQP